MDVVTVANPPAEVRDQQTPRQSLKRRVQQRSTHTREKLLAAARAVFVEKGYLATEVSDIVTRVPITKGALYHHFDGKEQLFAETCNLIARELHDASSDVVRPYSGDAWKQLTVSIHTLFELIAASPEARKILLIDGPSVLGWKRWRAIQAAVTQEPLQRTLDMLIDQGTIPQQPTRPLAQLLLAALNDAALSVAESDDPRAESAKLFASLLTLMNGLRLVRPV